MKLGISVVVCTFNGAALLPETIRHIAEQRVRPGIAWEVIVVDNASTDNTSEVVCSEWAKYNKPVEFTLLHQPKLGLTFARELSLEQAKYEFVLFCDDDNWLAPDYVNLAYNLMMQHPSIGVLGGNGELEFEETPPQWALGHGFFANGPQARTSGRVPNHIVYGAGCVIRRSAYESLFDAGFQPMLTDRIGGKLSSGGDHELCYAISLAGYDIWYDEKLRFKHFMTKGRLDWDYLIRFIKEGTHSFEVAVPYRILVNLKSKNMLTFNLQLIRIFASYSSLFIKLLLKKFLLNSESEKAKHNHLQLNSTKAKLLSFRNYSKMKHNFIKIKKFESDELVFTKLKTNLEAIENKSVNNFVLRSSYKN